MLHTTNGGTTWSKISTGANGAAAFFDVWGTSATDVYAVGDFGTLVHGSGSSWTKVGIGGGNGPSINCIWGASASEVYLFNVNGGVYKGAGTSFSTVTKPTSDTLLYGWGTAGGGDIWIPSLDNTSTKMNLWHSSDHGATWQAQKSGSTPIWAVWSTPAGHAFLVGGAIIEETTDHGTTWTSAGATQATLYGIGGDNNATDVWTVGTNGIILHRGPGG
jgi:photosystem II stability/assembly factor-like uncharacterized protein